MRYIADYRGRILEISFGADIECDGSVCVKYTGAIPGDYKSLEEWYLAEADKLYRWYIEDGDLTLNSTASAPKEEPQVDYVIAEGVSYDWHWKKWASGRADAWRRSDLADPETKAEGSVYYTKHTLSFPSALFIDVPVVNANLYGIYMGGVNMGTDSSPETFVFYVWTALNVSRANLLVDLHASGKWKE